MLKNRNILVTGASGFLGTNLIKELSKDQYNIIAVDKKKPGLDLGMPIENVDLKNSKKIRKYLKDINIVVHLASDIGSLEYMHDKQADILAENMKIDSVLYPAMVEAKVKTVVYASSSMVFQNSPVFPYSEKDLNITPPPSNTYGFSKLAGEYFCKAFAAQYNLNYVILRYHNIYGPSEVPKGNGPGYIHVIPALLKKVFQGQYPLELIGDPESSRPFTYIDDAVSATARIINEAAKSNPKIINNDFNIGTKDATKIIDLAKLIWNIFGDNRKFAYKIKKTVANTALKREMSTDKIEEAIGWTAKIDLETGVKKVGEEMKKRLNLNKRL